MIDPAITPIDKALLKAAEEASADGVLVEDGGGGKEDVTGEGADAHLSNLNHIGKPY